MDGYVRIPKDLVDIINAAEVGAELDIPEYNEVLDQLFELGKPIYITDVEFRDDNGCITFPYLFGNCMRLDDNMFSICFTYANFVNVAFTRVAKNRDWQVQKIVVAELSS